MIKWWRRRRYIYEATSFVKVATLMIGEEGKLLDQREDLQEVFAKEFELGTSPRVAGTVAAAAVLADAIHRDADTSRKADVGVAMTAWSQLDPVGQREMKKHLREGTLQQDMLVTRCQWLMLMAQDMLLEKTMEMSDFKIVKDVLWEAINQEAQGSRMIYGSKN
jgi:hypothetical protein